MKLTEIRTYHNEALTKIKEIYFIDEYNRKQGEYKFYYKNRKLAELSNYADGEICGISTHYNGDGSLFYTCNYINDDIIEDTYYNEKGESIGNGSL